MTPEQKQHAVQLLASRTDDEAIGEALAMLQELVDAPTPEPFGYFKAEPFGWTDCAETDDGAIALFAAPPAPSVPDGWRGLTDVEWMNIVNFDRAYSSYDKEEAVNEAVKRTEAKLKELNAPPHQSEHHLEMVNTPAPSVPDMPLSMEQFGGLVGLAREDAREKAIVYKATNIYGETCYFGVKSTAQAWAKSGSVDEVRLRELKVVAAPKGAK